jgi:hypothetical protein
MKGIVVCALLVGCGGDRSADENPGQDCPAGPYLTNLPVAEDAIAFATVLGPFSPPAHTLPSDHGGLYLTRKDVPLLAPGNLEVTAIRRTRYLASSIREGAVDFALELRACSAVRVSIGHIVSLSPKLASYIQAQGCQTYSTANETVEACYTNLHQTVSAGELIGTVGGQTAGAFDFGIYDSRHKNVFVNPDRYQGQMVTAVCPWSAFSDPAGAFLMSHVGRNGDFRTEEPRCGTMEVDKAGSAQGMWVAASRPVKASGDESAFVTLTYDVVHPSQKLLFSIGMPELGPGEYRSLIAVDGRRQRAFGDVAEDGLIYCYDVQGAFAPGTRISFFLALAADGKLRLQRRTDAEGCDGEPGSWAFGAQAVTLIR